MQHINQTYAFIISLIKNKDDLLYFSKAHIEKKSVAALCITFNI